VSLESMRSTGELRLVLKSSCGGGAASARARGGGGGGGREGSGMAGEGSGMAGEGILKLAKGGTAASSRTRRDMRDEPSSASSGSDSDSSSSSIARSHSLTAGASEASANFCAVKTASVPVSYKQEERRPNVQPRYTRASGLRSVKWRVTKHMFSSSVSRRDPRATA
jgi:hypothetical protein